MTEALIGFLIGVAGTYLVISEHYESGDADEIRALLREVRREETGVAGG